MHRPKQKSNRSSIQGDARTKNITERIMNGIFFVCGIIAVISVIFISLYMIFSGGPAIWKIGIGDFLLGTDWNPDNDVFGILSHDPCVRCGNSSRGADCSAYRCIGGGISFLHSAKKTGFHCASHGRSAFRHSLGGLWSAGRYSDCPNGISSSGSLRHAYRRMSSFGHYRSGDYDFANNHQLERNRPARGAKSLL